MRFERWTPQRLKDRRAPHSSHQSITTPHEPPQEDTTGKFPASGITENAGKFDQSQHYLLVFTQVTNGQPFIRIDTSKANWEGESATTAL
eukprot:scaffold8053_cov146-Isochrysis_galbana.AAC.1